MSQVFHQNSKRSDLQVLRGFSVVSVVIFHFFPNLLPYGYLGVDVFFVLSGYLITLVLYKKDYANYLTYLDFYFKRVRRIFPMSTMMVFLVSLYLLIMNQNELFEFNYRSAIAALFYGTNLKKLDEGEEYFRKLSSATDFFTHTWSLSVEIQFYCLAPTILTIGKILGQGVPGRFIMYSVVIATASLLFYLSVDSEIAFKSTMARLWQFLAGSIVFYCDQNSQGKGYDGAANAINQRLHQTLFFIIVISSALSFLLLELEISTRFICTILASSLVYIQSDCFILQSRFMSYIGDISYTLYLVHWPIVCVMRSHDTNTWQANILSILICFIISAIVHETYEKWYLTLSHFKTFALLTILYMSSILSIRTFNFVPSHLGAMSVQNQSYLITKGNKDLLYFRDDDTLPVFNWNEENMRNITEAESNAIDTRYAQEWLSNLYFESCTNGLTTMHGECIEPNGTGQYNMMIIGNSYSNNIGKIIVKHFRTHYATMNIYTISVCEPLLMTNIIDRCGDREKRKFIEKFSQIKPDVVFIMQRWVKAENRINTTNIEDDSDFQTIMSDLELYVKISKKVFILQPLLRTKGFNHNEIATDAAPMRKRMEEVNRRCDKCVVFDVQQQHLLDNSTLQLWHPHTRLHYFERSLHYSPYGLRLIEPVIANMSRVFDKLMERNNSNVFTGKL